MPAPRTTIAGSRCEDDVHWRAGLLLFPTPGMAAAPFNSRAAQRAALPPDLGERRTTEWKRTRERRAFVRGAAAGGLVTVLGVIIAVVTLMLTPSPHTVQTPQLVPPGSGPENADAIAEHRARHPVRLAEHRLAEHRHAHADRHAHTGRHAHTAPTSSPSSSPPPTAPP